MAVCPKCGSNSFRYELRSAGTRSKTNYYRTGVKNSWVLPAGQKTYRSQRLQKAVGVCADCGYVTQEKGFLWYLLCLLFLPITLSVWFYRSKAIKFDKKWRAVILAVFWIGFCIIGSYTESQESVEETIVNSVWSTETTLLSDFDYYIDRTEITLTDYHGQNKKINISPVYELNGKEYAVVSLDGTFALGGITSVIIPEGVLNITDNTFNSCGVKYLYLPSTLEKFSGWNYFHDVQKLYYGGTKEQWDVICSRDRSDIDVVQIVCDANTVDLIP